MNSTDRKLATLRNLARLRRVQLLLPDNVDLMDVRIHLEQELGGFVSQRVAARALGVCHTTVQRWASQGDLPTVITPTGKSAVPVGPLLRVMDSVDEVVRSGERKKHIVEPVIAEARQRATELQQHLELGDAGTDGIDPHDAAQVRARDLHRAIAFRLDSAMVDEAKRTLYRFERLGQIHPTYASQWREVLGGDLESIKLAITADDLSARDLRQNSPFAGALSGPEREVVYQAQQR